MKKMGFLFVAAVMCLVLPASADTWYVSGTGGHTAGTNWATAFTNIQTAVDMAFAGDVILVTNGVYSPIVTSNKTITIESVNGAAVTFIDGATNSICAVLAVNPSTATWTPTQTNTVLTGFTLMNGRNSLPSGDAAFGAGVRGGTLNHCVLTNNAAIYAGGGAACSVLNDCVLTGNSAEYGGGATHTLLRRCTVTGNSATGAGGGTHYSPLENSLVAFNHCSALSSAQASGVNLGTLTNCTVVSNTGTYGVNSATTTSTIVWGNPAGNITGSAAVAYSCTMPAANGTGNITNNPLFVSAETGDFRLQDVSPCVDVGDPANVSTGTDLAGNPRVNNGRVDMGAYEFTEEDWDGITWYVSETAGNDNNSGKSWAHAKQSIQAAIDLAEDGDFIWVADGEYGAIATSNKAITIQSENGAATTFINGSNTAVCAVLSRDSAVTIALMMSETNTVLTGFTLMNGNNTNVVVPATDDNIATYGAGSRGGTLNRCVLTNNVAAERGGGAGFGVLNECTLAGNSAGTSGGGTSYGTLNNCVLTGNRANTGGGAHISTLNNCVLTGNHAYDYGGGAENGTLNNCVIYNNTADESGGGANYVVMNNCTLYGNQASRGSDTLSCYLTNSISWSDETGGASKNLYSMFSYSCYSEITESPGGGVGNITENPLFVNAAAGNFRLQTNSPCINLGDPAAVQVAEDMDGNPMISNGLVSMGAYAAIGENELAVAPDSVLIRAIGETFQITVTAGGTWRASTENSWITLTPSAGSMNGTIFVTVAGNDGESRNGAITITSGEHTAIVAVTQHVRYSDVWYVSVSGNDSDAGTNWATAVSSIQEAVERAVDGNRIWVMNGTYSRISTDNKAIIIESMSGAQDTIIEGDGNNPCAAMGAFGDGAYYTNTVLNGFTLRGGGGNHGGGSLHGTLNDCILSNNTVKSDGGGAYRGVLNNCVIANNTATSGGIATGDTSYGGGAYQSTLNNCAIFGNSVGNLGGGAYESTLIDCVVYGNIAWRGGGVHNGSADRCAITNNIASYDGGGARNAILTGCTLANNTAQWGGGASDSTLTRCYVLNNTATHSISNAGGGGLNYCTAFATLIAGNTAKTSGGGVRNGSSRSLVNCTVANNTAPTAGGITGLGANTVRNSIVYGNTGGNWDSADANTAFEYTCTTPAAAGTGNTTNAPLFASSAFGNFRLQTNSPCLNAGTVDGIAGDALDLDGSPLIASGLINMGAFSGIWSGYIYTTTTPVPIPYDWFEANGLVTNGAPAEAYETAGYADADRDGHAAWEEYIAGTDPDDAEDVLRVYLDAVEPNPVITYGPTNIDRIYTIQGVDLITNTPAWSTNLPTILTAPTTHFYRATVIWTNMP